MTTPLGSAYRNPPGIRLDPDRLDPRWRRPVPPGRLSASLKILIVLAILVALFGAVWAAGGFKQRNDRVRAYPLGTPINVGPATVTFSHAELTYTENEVGDTEPHWKFRGIGTATNTTDETQLLFESGVVALPTGDRFSRLSVRTQRLTVTGERVNDFGNLQPGLVDVPIVIEGELPARWEPTGHVFVGIRQQSYEAHDADRGLNNVYWANGPLRWLGSWVPVRVVPEPD